MEKQTITIKCRTPDGKEVILHPLDVSKLETIVQPAFEVCKNVYKVADENSRAVNCYELYKCSSCERFCNKYY